MSARFRQPLQGSRRSSIDRLGRRRLRQRDVFFATLECELSIGIASDLTARPHGCFSVHRRPSRRHSALGFSGLIEAALSLRHKTFETELTGFGEHDRTSAASAYLR